MLPTSPIELVEISTTLRGYRGACRPVNATCPGSPRRTPGPPYRPPPPAPADRSPRYTEQNWTVAAARRRTVVAKHGRGRPVPPRGSKSVPQTISTAGGIDAGRGAAWRRTAHRSPNRHTSYRAVTPAARSGRRHTAPCVARDHLPSDLLDHGRQVGVYDDVIVGDAAIVVAAVGHRRGQTDRTAAIDGGVVHHG